MMRGLVVISIVVVGLSSVRLTSAQPGAAPPYGYAAQPQPMPVQLTVDDQFLLQRGYISDGEHLGGGIVAVMFGLGIGHAIQGRWTEKGWIFTVGEGVSGALFIWGMTELFAGCFEGCTERQESRAATKMLVGLAGSMVFRVWEVYDAFAGPGEHNRKVRNLHMRLGMPVPLYTRLSPYVAPPRDGDGAVAGLSLRF